MSAKPAQTPAADKPSPASVPNAATAKAVASVSRAAPGAAPGAGPPDANRAPAGQAPTWRQDDGAPVSCVEKIKVLNENYAELKQTAQDAFEDALLMGCSETQVRDVLRELIDSLDNPYRKIRQNPEQE
jgi:hypothetical protein